MDHNIEITPGPESTHTIASNGLMYQVSFFMENEDGDGGFFKVSGMDCETKKPDIWLLSRIGGDKEHRIRIFDLCDSTDIYCSSGPKPQQVPNTSCRFSYE